MKFKNIKRCALKSFLLLGSSAVAFAGAASAQQAPSDQAGAAQDQVSENVLVTGSLIHGTAVVGAPLTSLSTLDLSQVGAVTIADVFRTLPDASVQPGPVATNGGQYQERSTAVTLRGGTEAFLIDGMIMAPGGKVGCVVDPSIIPQLAIDRLDVLLDGASAVYGTNAVGGVINIILKRGFDGAETQVQYTNTGGGENEYRASQLWGRTWDGGDLTLSTEYYNDTEGKSPSSNWTQNYTPWGLDNQIPLASSGPATLVIGTIAGTSTLMPSSVIPLGNNCANCYAVPKGTGVTFNGGANGLGPGVGNAAAPTLMWNGTNFVATSGAASGTAAGSGANGTANEFNPYSIADFAPAEQRFAATMTVDQRLISPGGLLGPIGVTFSGEAFYSNRRSEYIDAADESPAGSTDFSGLLIPTSNPYYPTGLPAGSKLSAYLNFATEQPPVTDAFEITSRWETGFKLDLPFNWNGNIYYGISEDTTEQSTQDVPNTNAVSAALGWTIPAAATGSGSYPPIGSFTKPATVPYLNVLCDTTSIAQCNSPATIAYIESERVLHNQYMITDAGAVFDGPLFDLPGGQLKAAVGGGYQTWRMTQSSLDDTGAPSLLIPTSYYTGFTSIWNGYAQFDIPIFSDKNAIPFFEKLTIEPSIRHDQYSEFGGTTNPKVAVTWMPHDWLTLRGDYGTNFSAPTFANYDPLGNASINAYNANGTPGVGNETAVSLSCTAQAGSGAYNLHYAGTAGTNVPCTNTTSVGIAQIGSAGVSIDAGLRNYQNQAWQVLNPTTSTNWSGGFEFAPTDTFLKGLDLQLTYYNIKTLGTGNVGGGATTTAIGTASAGTSYIIPSSLAPGLAKAGLSADATACAAANNTPWTCPEFVAEVTALVSSPRSSLPTSLIPAAGNPTSTYWIYDGGTENGTGYTQTSGLDFNDSYAWDLGNYGAWDFGVAGTYLLTSTAQSFAGGPITNIIKTSIDAGTVAATSGYTSPRLKYRTRLGWTDGTYSATIFMNYQSHFNQTSAVPPDVNGNFCQANGTTPYGTSACLINNYTAEEPSYYTFDLSLGYDTGESPSNPNLRDINVQLSFNDIFNKHPPFEYNTTTNGGFPSAFVASLVDTGRIISLTVTKQW